LHTERKKLRELANGKASLVAKHIWDKMQSCNGFNKKASYR